MKTTSQIEPEDTKEKKLQERIDKLFELEDDLKNQIEKYRIELQSLMSNRRLHSIPEQIAATETARDEVRNKLNSVIQERSTLIGQIQDIKKTKEAERRERELPILRKSILETIAIKASRLDDLKKILSELSLSLKDTENIDGKLDDVYERFRSGDISSQELAKEEKYFLEMRAQKESSEKQLEVIVQQKNVLEKELQALYENLRSVERYIWDFVFSKLQDQFLNLISKDFIRLVVAMNNAAEKHSIDSLINNLLKEVSTQKLHEVKAELEAEFFTNGKK